MRRITTKLEETELYYSDLYENAPVAYVTFDQGFAIRSGNRAFRALFGLDRLELTRQPVTAYLAPASQDEFYLHTRPLWKGNPVAACQVEITHGTNRRYFKVESNLSKIGGEALIRSLFVDVTKEVETEALLRVSEERFVSVVEAATDGILIADSHGRLLVWNAAMESITGFGHETMVGAFVWDAQYAMAPKALKIPGGLAKLEEQNRGFLAALKEGAPPVAHEQKIEKADGSAAVIEFTVFPMKLKGEVLFGGLFRDLTYSRGLEVQLAEARKNEAIGLLAGGIAHDFNNLLGGILGRVELAKTREGLSETLEKDLRQIEQAAKRSAAITGQLLAYARRQIATPMVVDLGEVVHGLLPALRRLLSPQIRLEFVAPPGPATILMDTDQLDQNVTAVCRNASEAIRGAGKVTLAVRLNAGGDKAMLTVTDTGHGMDDATLKSAFEPFFSTKPMGHGVGLGLATVQGIVFQNGGGVQLRSAPGQGTTVEFSFPAHAVPPDTPSSSAIQPADIDRPTQGSEALQRVLIVDDEPDILEFLVEIVASLGFAVSGAESAEAALSLVSADGGKFDLLVTDVMMPGKNGHQLAQELVAASPGLAVLYMSGFSGDVLAEKGILAAELNFLQKPFTLAEVSRKVAGVLQH